MHILMNLNDFDAIFLFKFYPTIFCSENSKFLVLLENNNMKRLLKFPLCMMIIVLF
jgi:hypothetical protein